MPSNYIFKNLFLRLESLCQDKHAFTLMEILVVVVIFLFMMAGIIGVFYVGQRTWQNTETSIEIQQDIRKITMRVFRELRETGYSDDPAILDWRYDIISGVTLDDPDILRFQIPVDWDNDGDVVTLDGVAGIYYIDWGASMHWADRNPTCEGEVGGGEPEGTCHYLGYWIEYSVDNGQLVRKFLDGTFQEESRAVFANNIVNFKVIDTPPNPTPEQDVMIDVAITAQATTLWGRVMTSTLTSQVILRNREK